MQQIHPYSYNSNGITYPTALDLSGNLVSAVTAPKQARYTCLECEVNMAVCRGEVKRPHFRHLSESNVERLCNPESYIHKLAKRLLKEKLDLALRENTPFILKWKCTDCRKDFSVNLTDYIDQVEVEQSLFNGAARPDLTLFKDGKPVITLEVVNTHAPEEKTLRLCEDNDVKVFVISVSPQDNLVDDWADSKIDGKWVCPADYWGFSVDTFSSDDNQLNYLKKNGSSDLFKSFSVSQSFPWCSNCTQTRINRKIDDVFREKQEKRQIEQKKIQDQNNLRGWDGKELITLSDEASGTNLGLFMGYWKDINGTEWVSFCDMNQAKVADGVLWIKDLLPVYDVFRRIEKKDALLSGVKIKKRHYDPFRFVESNSDIKWCRDVWYEYTTEKEQQKRIKESKEVAEQKRKALLAKKEAKTANCIDFYNKTTFLPVIKNRNDINKIELARSQDANAKRPLTNQEIVTEYIISQIWDRFFKYRQESNLSKHGVSCSYFEHIPFLVIEGVNNSIYAILGISLNSFSFCNSKILYACEYSQLGNILFDHINKKETSLWSPLKTSKMPGYIRNRVLKESNLFPYFIRQNIDSIIVTEKDKNDLVAREKDKYYFPDIPDLSLISQNSIIPLTVKDLKPLPGDKELWDDNEWLTIKACVSFNEKEKAKDLGFQWDAKNKMWITFCTVIEYMKYIQFLPFKCEILESFYRYGTFMDPKFIEKWKSRFPQNIEMFLFK